MKTKLDELESIIKKLSGAITYTHDDFIKYPQLLIDDALLLISELKEKKKENKFEIGDYVQWDDYSSIGGPKAGSSTIKDKRIGNYYLLENGTVMTGNHLRKKELKLEVGKFYRTRNGKKVFIHFADERLFHGCVIDGMNGYTFYENGIYDLNQESPHDIISEWED